MFPEQPKQIALHFFAASIVILWAIEYLLPVNRKKPLPDLRKWFGRSPARWAVAAAAILAVVASISTILSRAPSASLWGRDFSHLGYELYSFLALLVLFLAAAMKVRGRIEIQRVVWAMVLTGTLSSIYGISQHFGWDPFGPGEHETRIWSTFLNPIFFGSYLTMSIFMTMGIAFIYCGGRRPGLWQLLFAAAIGLQLAALWWTSSRGPLVGVGVGAVVMTVVAVLRFDRSTLLNGLSIGAAGLIIAVFVRDVESTAASMISRDTGSLTHRNLF